MAQYDINLREYWRVLKKRKFIVIFIAIVVGIFSTSLAVVKAPTPIYTTVCSIEFEEAPRIKGIYSATVSWSESDNVETQISLIKSYAVFQKVAEKLRLISPGSSSEDGQLQEAVIRVIEGLQSRVEVERESVTSILNIKVTDTNPAFAQKLANTIALAYKELHAEDQMKRNKETMRYISEQLTEVRGRLREAEDEFNRFTQDNELISIDLQSENLLARAQEIQDEIRRLREDKRELGEILGRLNGFVEDPSGSGHDFYSSIANTQYQSTYDKLVSLLLKKDTLLKNFTPKHPEVQAISYEIMENARKMGILLQLQISGIEKKEIDLGRELEKVDKKTKVLMDKKLEFNRLKRKVDLYTNMAALLEQKNQEALIKRAEKPEEVKIVKPALLPTQPINPPKTAATGAAGVMIGLVLGIVIGFVVETFDTSLGAIEDVEETLGTQVLGIVPQADVKDMIEGLKEKYPGGISLPGEKRMSYLVSHFVPKSMMSESFRALRTNVQFKDAEKKTKAIAVTSSSPQEGKTLVAVNLAIAMAQARMKVLLIGSDLRKPAIDKVFDVEMTPGLTDILLENYQWRDTVKTVMDMAMGELTQTQIIRTPGLDNLHIITSGPIPPNPAELIDSPTFTEFMEEAKEDYDMIIFDSPPILSTADAAILGAKVDGVLLVYRVGSVSKGLLKRSVTQLQQVKSNILGVILNGMRPEVSPDFQDYKYYSYYYSYGEEGKDKRRRDLKKGWAFLGRKGEKESKEAQQEATIRDEGVGSEKKEAKKRTRRLFLLLVATAILALGILWQNDLMDPFKVLDKKPAKQQEKRDELGKKASQTPVSRRPEKVSSTTKPAVSKKKDRLEKRKTVIETPPASKPLPDINASETEKKTPEPVGPSRKTEPASSRLKPTVSVDKAADKTPSTSIPKSPPASIGMAPTKTAPVPERNVSYPYSLYLGSFQNLERAKKAVSLYAEKGFSVYWVKVLLSKGTWYRVYAGYFEDAEKAERFRREERLKEATIKKTPYANFIGVFRSSDEVGDKISYLSNLGFSSYAVKDPGGKFRLYVGAFYPEYRAKRQYNDLKSSGIESQVVKR
ncbi:MAG: polysaccharide biosynthesis tyrosine autokinase [Desulfobacteraceae bacterium]